MAATMQGKVALITGGGSGIGRAASVAFARAGAKVVIGDVVTEGGNRTVELIRDIGGEATFVPTDVTHGREVERLVKSAVDTYGGLDCAYNNAGIEGAQVGIVDCTEEEWQRVIAIDLTGVWLCLKHEIPAMTQTRWRQYRQHLVSDGSGGSAEHPGIYRQQARRRGPDQGGSAGIRTVQNPGQRGVPRGNPYADDRTYISCWSDRRIAYGAPGDTTAGPARRDCRRGRLAVFGRGVVRDRGYDAG